MPIFVRALSCISLMTGRIRLLERLAQAPPAGTQTGPQTSISGAPTQIDIFSYFPTVIIGWGNANVPYIQRLVNILNQTIFVLSAGQMDFNKLRMQSFSFDPSKFPDRILLGVVRFSTIFYRLVLSDNGLNFKEALLPEHKALRVQRLVNFIPVFNIPDGSINQFLLTRIGGNLKMLLLTTLQQIK